MIPGRVNVLLWVAAMCCMGALQEPAARAQTNEIVTTNLVVLDTASIEGGGLKLGPTNAQGAPLAWIKPDLIGGTNGSLQTVINPPGFWSWEQATNAGANPVMIMALMADGTLLLYDGTTNLEPRITLEAKGTNGPAIYLDGNRLLSEGAADSRYPIRSGSFWASALGGEATSAGTDGFAFGREAEAGDGAVGIGQRYDGENFVGSRALGRCSVALGGGEAFGENSFAAGGSAARADGYGSVALAAGQAEGYFSMAAQGGAAQGYGSFAFGVYSLATNTGSIAMGRSAKAFGNDSFAGPASWAQGDYSVALGQGNASGSRSFAGVGGTASGYDSLAIGSSAQASGGKSVAIGPWASASGYASVSLGESTHAPGVCSFGASIDGYAEGEYSAAFGYGSRARALTSIAGGWKASADGAYSMALGPGARTTSGGYGAFALGSAVSAEGANQMVIGAANIPDPDAALIVGNGVWVMDDGNASADTPSNCFVVKKNGDTRIYGGLRVDGATYVVPGGDISMGAFTNGPAQ